jgi:hypothetical protein
MWYPQIIQHTACSAQWLALQSKTSFNFRGTEPFRGLPASIPSGSKKIILLEFSRLVFRISKKSSSLPEMPVRVKS